MKRSRILSCAVLLSFFTITVFAADPSLPDLFKRAKEKFAAGDHRGSLSDFELLDTNSAKPGFENDRAKLIRGGSDLIIIETAQDIDRLAAVPEGDRRPLRTGAQ